MGRLCAWPAFELGFWCGKAYRPIPLYCIRRMYLCAKYSRVFAVNAIDCYRIFGACINIAGFLGELNLILSVYFYQLNKPAINAG